MRIDLAACLSDVFIVDWLIESVIEQLVGVLTDWLSYCAIDCIHIVRGAEYSGWKVKGTSAESIQLSQRA